MKKINQFIFEKLKISSKSVFEKRDLSKVKTHNVAIIMNVRWEISEKNFEQMKKYQQQNVDPNKLVNKINNKDTLILRWNIAVKLGWLECAKIFRQRIIDKKFLTEDELDAYILRQYTLLYSKSEQMSKRFENYLDEFDVKYNEE